MLEINSPASGPSSLSVVWTDSNNNPGSGGFFPDKALNSVRFLVTLKAWEEEALLNAATLSARRFYLFKSCSLAKIYQTQHLVHRVNLEPEHNNFQCLQ